MKRKIYLFGIIAALLLAACGESLEDTYSDYAGDGPIRYVAKCTDLEVIPGWKAVTLKWNNGTDSRIDKIKVVWTADEVKDSMFVAAGTDSLVIRNMGDANYRFDLYAMDKDDNASLAETYYGRPFSETHEVVRTFTSGVVKYFYRGDKFFYFADRHTDNIVEIALKYKDKEGQKQIHTFTSADYPTISSNGTVSDKICTLENVSENPQDTVYVLRRGKIEGCIDTIDFEPLVLNRNVRSFTSDFVQTIYKRYGFTDGTEEQKAQFDHFIDTVRVLEFDYDMTTMEDILYCPKLEQLVLGKNRYVQTATIYTYTSTDRSKLSSPRRTTQILPILRNQYGLKVTRYARQYYSQLGNSYVDEQLSDGPVFPDLTYVAVDSVTSSITSLSGDPTLPALIDGDPATQWYMWASSTVRSYDLTLYLHQDEDIRGVMISQFLTPSTNASWAPYFPSSVMVKTSVDGYQWKNVTHLEENQIGRGLGERTLIPIGDEGGTRKARYVRVTVRDVVSNNICQVTLGEIGVYK